MSELRNGERRMGRRCRIHIPHSGHSTFHILPVRLCEDNEGYARLCALITRRNLEPDRFDRVGECAAATAGGHVALLASDVTLLYALKKAGAEAGEPLRAPLGGPQGRRRRPRRGGLAQAARSSPRPWPPSRTPRATPSTGSCGPSSTCPRRSRPGDYLLSPAEAERRFAGRGSPRPVAQAPSPATVGRAGGLVRRDPSPGRLAPAPPAAAARERRRRGACGPSPTRAWPGACATFPCRTWSAWSGSWRSSCAWASRGTSSWWRTSRASRGTRASPTSAGARAPAASSPTASSSPTWTRWPRASTSSAS